MSDAAPNNESPEQQRMRTAVMGPRSQRDQELFMDKLIRKVKRDPLIPLGTSL